MQKLFPGNTFVAPKLPSGKDLVRLVIAEAPGAEEAEKGEPLVGGSGKVFDRLIRAAGISRQGLTLANCIQCRPPNNVFPTDPAARSYISKDDAQKAVTQCYQNHVLPLLRSRDWNRVDLLGDKPLRIVAGKTSGISNLRGSPLSISRDGNNPLRGLAIYHPSYLMRDQVFLPVAVNDLKKSLDEPAEHYSPFPSIEQVRGFKHTRFVADIECPKYRTLGKSAPIEMVGFCATPGEAICVPVRGEYASEIKRIFRDATEIIGHNILQFDLPKLRDIDIKVGEQCLIHDTLLQQHLLCPDLPHDLEFVGSQFCSKPAWKSDKSGGWELYCCRDCDVNFQCWQRIYPELKEEGLADLYWNTQVPLAKICYLMHETGIKVDPTKIGAVREQLLARMEELERQLPEELRTRTVEINKRVLAPPGTLGKSGKPVKFISAPASKKVVPWRSPDAKKRYFYSSVKDGGLGCEPVLDPKSGAITTGKVAIAKLFARTKNPAILALGEMNRIDERLTTFASDAMKKVGRIHSHFNVHGTASGRLSSSDPNAQNIPEAVRVIYVPSHEGWKIIDVDFSNIENRLTAWFAGDPRLKKYDDPNYSDYKILASRYHKIPYDEVVKDNNRNAPYGMAKIIVLGTNYGMGYKKIANTYNLDLGETRRLQEAWKAEIAPTIEWQKVTAEKARKQGFLVTPFGRKRYFYTSSYYTESLSFLPQSTAADLIFRAMIGLLYEQIGLPKAKAELVCPIVWALPKPAKLLLQVHDALTFECPNEMVEEIKIGVKQVMEQAFPELRGLVIPISIKVGNSWGN
jgi:uracil-DNA glycosylase family 4